MERKLNFSVGEYYHIYNRGIEKRNIFLDTGDRERFLRLLYVANGSVPFKFSDIKNSAYSKIERGDPRVAIGAYCLMPNHFHMLIRETVEGGISAFMEKLMTGYSMYFNKKYVRVGPLFQSRFKAQHVDNDNYLKYLFAYIHLNPIKLIDPEWKENGIANIKSAEMYLKDYRFSSYADYMGVSREENTTILKEEFPDYFETPREFGDFVKDWLLYRDDGQ